MTTERQAQVKAIADKLFDLSEDTAKLDLWLSNGAYVPTLLAMVATELRRQAESRVVQMKPPKEER